MKTWTGSICALALGLGLAGGTAHAQEEQLPADVDTSTAELTGTGQGLVPGVPAGKFLRPFKLRDCWYFVANEIWGRGAPNQLTIRRMPTPHCEAASRVLDTSYDAAGTGTFLATAQGNNELVIAYWVRRYPYPLQGAVRLFHVDLNTLENRRTLNTDLLATGSIQASRIAFEGRNLIVQGSKTGTLPGESGSGDSYTATFERFLDTDAPPTIVAHTDAPASEPTPQITEGVYYPGWGGRMLPPFQIKDCWYFTTLTMPPYVRGPTQYQLYVSRLAVNGCQGKTVWLGKTYDPSTLVMAPRGDSFALAWAVKLAPLDIPQAPTTLQLLDISTDTLTNSRTSNNEFQVTGGGRIQASQLEFQGHRLIVQGTKTGPITGESSSGGHFTAVFDHFLDGQTPPALDVY